MLTRLLKSNLFLKTIIMNQLIFSFTNELDKCTWQMHVEVVPKTATTPINIVNRRVVCYLLQLERLTPNRKHLKLLFTLNEILWNTLRCNCSSTMHCRVNVARIQKSSVTGSSRHCQTFIVQSNNLLNRGGNRISCESQEQIRW